MAQTRSLPRICIALGLPDVPTLLEHARREAESGEIFLEFRLDYLSAPCKGAEAIPQFLEQYPDCILLATCRRHQNHGKFNGSVEEQFRILNLAVQHGAQAVDVEIETAETALSVPLTVGLVTILKLGEGGVTDWTTVTVMAGEVPPT